jgi:hypothetical protein
MVRSIRTSIIRQVPSVAPTAPALPGVLPKVTVAAVVAAGHRLVDSDGSSPGRTSGGLWSIPDPTGKL